MSQLNNIEPQAIIQYTDQLLCISRISKSGTGPAIALFQNKRENGRFRWLSKNKALLLWARPLSSNLLPVTEMLTSSGRNHLWLLLQYNGTSLFSCSRSQRGFQEKSNSFHNIGVNWLKDHISGEKKFIIVSVNDPHKTTKCIPIELNNHRAILLMYRMAEMIHSYRQYHQLKLRKS